MTREFLKQMTAASPDEVRWQCPQCGTVEPYSLCGRYIRRKCTCELAEEERMERLARFREWRTQVTRRTYTWLGERWSDLDLLEKTFDIFDTTYQREAYDAARLFALCPDGTFVLHGSYGTGKTHLLAAIANACEGSLFTTSPNLFAAIQARIGAKEDYSRLITAAIQAPLLVIDDIDKAKWSEFREELYFELVDKRVRTGRPLAISTNRLDHLTDFVGGAVCSRFKIGQIAIEMVGADYREVV